MLIIGPPAGLELPYVVVVLALSDLYKMGNPTLFICLLTAVIGILGWAFLNFYDRQNDLKKKRLRVGSAVVTSITILLIWASYSIWSPAVFAFIDWTSSESEIVVKAPIPRTPDWIKPPPQEPKHTLTQPELPRFREFANKCAKIKQNNFERWQLAQADKTLLNLRCTTEVLSVDVKDGSELNPPIFESITEQWRWFQSGSQKLTLIRSREREQFSWVEGKWKPVKVFATTVDGGAKPEQVGVEKELAANTNANTVRAAQGLAP